MNSLSIGFIETVHPPQRGLFIHDEAPDIDRARIFDPTVHSFNPLKGIDYKTARQLVLPTYAAFFFYNRRFFESDPLTKPEFNCFKVTELLRPQPEL